MFFNPEDVYYYKNVELVTKNGLRVILSNKFLFINFLSLGFH